MMIRNPNALRLFVLSLSTIAVSILIPQHCVASGFPAPSTDVILWSARSCYAEATWSQADCSALLHVIKRRAEKAKWSFLRMLKAYSVKNWIQSEHGQHALALRLGANKVSCSSKSRDVCRQQTATWNQQWQELVMHVVDVLGERAEDPCPAANHWAAKYYHPKFAVRRVECSAPVANAFYAER